MRVLWFFVVILLSPTVSNAQAPGGASSDLQSWYKGNAGTSSTVNNSVLTFWNDQSGNAHHLDLATGDPIYVDEGVNFNPLIEFDGDDFFTDADGNLYFNGLSAVTIFAIIKSDETNSDRSFFDTEAGDDQDDKFTVRYDASGASGGGINNLKSGVETSGGNTSSESESNIQTTEVQLLTTNWSSGNNFNWRINGRLTTNTFDAGVVTGTISGSETILIGTGRDSWLGDIAELVIYSFTPSEEEYQRIEAYLALKYGISLNNADGGIAGDYINSSSTTIWDASTNSLYQNNIAGIGRDDGSDLSQPKSKNQNAGGILTIANTESGGTFANPDNFTADNDFLIWGHDNDDNGTVEAIASELPAGFVERLDREWKVAVNGTVGTVSIEADLSSLALQGNSAADFSLVIDEDGNGNFEDGLITTVLASSLSSEVLLFDNVVLSNNDVFTIASVSTISSIQAPAGIDFGINLWLRADSGTSSEVDNTNLTFWSDVSGRTHNLTTVNSDPSFQETSINFNPAIDFDGNDWFTDDDGEFYINGASTITVFSVIESDNTDVNSCFFDTEAPDGSDDAFSIRYDAVGAFGGCTNCLKTGVSATGASASHESASNIQSTDPQLITTNWNSGDNVSFRLNGESTTNTNNGSPPASGVLNNSTEVNVGNGTQGDWNGRIAELLVYTESLSVTERAQIETYLCVKYGITRGNADGGIGGDYVDSDNNTLWDASVLSTYHNDIAGIGRDDLSNLSQIKSKSENADGVLIIANTESGGNFDTPDEFSANQHFLIWGNDNDDDGIINEITTEIPPGFTHRLDREWKIQMIGSVSSVSVQFDLNSVSVTGAAASDYFLIIDEDGNGDFTDGSITSIASSSFAGGLVLFDNVSLSNNDVISLGILGIPIEGPGNVDSGVQLWLKADAGTSSSVDGDALTSWIDQTGLSHNATSVISDPTFVVNDVNYNPGINFDGNDSFTDDDGENYINNANSIAVFSLVKSVNTDVNNAFFDTEEADSQDDVFSIRYDAAGASGGCVNCLKVGVSTTGGNSNWESASNLQSTDPSLLSINWASGNSVSMRLNGASSTNTSNGTVRTGSLNNADRVLVGNGTQGFWDGSINELIIYTNTLLSESDRRRVESYLALKYGITLSTNDGGNAGDYLASNGSTLWDASENLAYHQDVIGVGRDDESGLNQRQSQSLDDTTRIYIDALSVDNITNGGSFSSDSQFVVIGHNGDEMCSTGDMSELPTGISSKIQREWKSTNTNFDGTFGVDLSLSSCARIPLINTSDLRLLVDDDGDFGDALVFSSADGLTFTNNSGIISIRGIGVSQIPEGSTRFFTLASSDLNTPLPIELIDFNAEVINNSVIQLRWKTATETNNDYFTIEKSVDASNWEVVEFVSGSGNSNAVLAYSSRDENPFTGLSYYRLKQTDFDGRFSFSEVVTVNIAPSNREQLYPNPTDGLITLRGKTLKKDEIRILDPQGIEITALISIDIIENGIFQLDFTEAKRGIYLVTTTERTHKVYLK